MAGIYIHIPFCAKRCQYCAFFSTTRHGDIARYAEDVCKELELRRDYLNGANVGTIYFGGGTPSQLSASQIAMILNKIKSDDVLEITVECNPDDITSDFIRELRNQGVNRISMGVQTFNDSLLASLGRRHNAEQAVRAVSDCHKGGIDNISIDLMYGLPGQTLEMQKHDLECATALDVTHISSYCLSYEEGTPLFRLKDQGASDELCQAMYQAMCNHFNIHGFQHYEISNFALPGFNSRHNSSYWDGTPYLGVGAGAHSFDGTHRQWNVSNLDEYMSGIEQGECRFEQETLTDTDRINETVMLSLRTSLGLDMAAFESRFGLEQTERLKAEASRFISTGRLSLNGKYLSVPEFFWFVSDDIISSLFVL